ncbi:MAG: fatty acid desaturase family protein [Myxococcota bacterium]|nr:fatty acid desaturase family protein [Myxococcota bacterium]
MDETTIESERPPSWRKALSREEIDSLLKIRDWRGWLTIGANWAIVFASFCLVAWSPNPGTILVALFVIGGRQLGMAVIMHEAAHHTMFNDRKLNDIACNWLAAYPVWADVGPYRSYHLVHHARTGSEEDPDLGLVTPFPITRASFRRKIWRDLSGQTGWKQFLAVLRRDLGTASKNTMRSMGISAGARPDVGWHKLVPVIVSNAALFGVVAAFGHPELYLLWVVAWFTTYRLVTRLRSIAEHAIPSAQDDPLGNTRTTLARWWERLLLAPNRVNYHLEHHLLMTVPHYNLPRMHQLLKERGVLSGALIARGYYDVFDQASSKAA